jgi:hypothetical protein
VFGQPWSYQIPAYLDFFGQFAQSFLELGAADHFVKFENRHIILSVEPSSIKLAKSVGSYKVLLKLIDIKGYTETRSFNLSVVLATKKGQEE